MISPGHVRAMARYNAWQNRSAYDAAAGLPEAELTRERGAFFGSILKTLNHIYWADQIWLSRFKGEPRPVGGAETSTRLHGALVPLRAARDAYDATILDWAAGVDEAWLGSELTWRSGLAEKDFKLPAWICVTHFFNHQTHHRGQAHAMLTAAGAKPEATDLYAMAVVETGQV